MPHRLFLPLAVVLGAVLAGCAAAPQTRWHSLSSGTPPVRAAGAASAGALVVQIDTPQLPRQLDQPQWLVRRSDDSLVAMEQERWSTALGDELRAALVDQLAQRYGVTDARLVSGNAPWRLTLQVLRLETLPDRGVQWDSVWSLAGTGRSAPLTCRASARIAAGSGGFPALAAAHRAALAQLAEQIGSRLLRMQTPGAQPGCDGDA